MINKFYLTENQRTVANEESGSNGLFVFHWTIQFDLIF